LLLAIVKAWMAGSSLAVTVLVGDALFVSLE
jgi:hypothetical protein